LHINDARQFIFLCIITSEDYRAQKSLGWLLLKTNVMFIKWCGSLPELSPTIYWMSLQTNLV